MEINAVVRRACPGDGDVESGVLLFPGRILHGLNRYAEFLKTNLISRKVEREWETEHGALGVGLLNHTVLRDDVHILCVPERVRQ